MLKIKLSVIILLITSAHILYGQDNEISWKVIAKSSNIYRVNSSYLKNNINNYAINNYANVNIPVLQTIKGEAKDEVILRIYMYKEDYDFFCSLQDNVEIILFLQKLYNPWGPKYGNEFNYYLVDDINNSIIVSDTIILNNLLEEITFQEKIINDQLYKNFNIDVKMNDKINSIINNITNRSTQKN
jgi:hypothetical protein